MSKGWRRVGPWLAGAYLWLGSDAVPQAAGGEASGAESGCSRQQLEAIVSARQAAFERSKAALELLMRRDTTLAGLAGGPTPGQRLARGYARRLFAAEVSAADVQEDILPRLARMTLLQREAGAACAPAASRECARFHWRAFVNGHASPMRFCPAFFARSREDDQPLAERQLRTIMHESAHLAGIGEPGHEAYCFIWDCQTPCHGQDSADAWAQLLSCLGGQRPDEPITVRAGGR